MRYFGEDVPGVSQVRDKDNLVSLPHLSPPIFYCQSFSEDQTFSYQDDEGTITVLGSPIKFDPPNLNFKERFVKVGLPPNFSDFKILFQAYRSAGSVTGYHS